MDPRLKKILRAVSLEIRRLLEGRYDDHGQWQAGDLERRLNEIGIWREDDRKPKPLEELPHLSAEDKAARRLVDGYLKLREEADVPRSEAVAEFVREAAYTWANRLFALRCMEARGIIDEVVLQKAAYGGRSMVHNRFAKKNPEACAGEDDGLFAVLFAEFTARSAELPGLFDPQSPAVALRPSVGALKKTVALLSGTESARSQEAATDEVFAAPDAFGWAYQYWNADEKDRVFEMVRTKKGAKIQGADIIPATQLYTEPYMVKFLVQNSLGSLWMGMYPDSELCEQWEYFVKDADRAPVTRKPVREITFLDPAQGSGHFHLEAFDLFYAMYEEEAGREGRTMTPREICAAILNHNLYGIDIDGRSVQIATAALWMKARERAPDLEAGDLNSFHEHLVATNIRLPKERNHLELFLKNHPEDEPLRPALELVFQGLEHADELGALLQIEELVDAVMRRLKEEADKTKGTAIQTGLFEPTPVQGTFPVGVEDYDKWKRDALSRLQTHFKTEARAADAVQAFFGKSAGSCLTFFNLLARRYDAVAANPPYMGSGAHGPCLTNYLEAHYSAGKSDLYGAFLLRIIEMTVRDGRWAFVCPRGWLTLGTLEPLRAALAELGTLGLGLDLGPGAFEEISGEVVSVILCVGEARKCSPERRVKFLDLRDSSDKYRCFLEGNLKAYESPHAVFERLPGRRFAYRLNEKEVALFATLRPLRDQCFMTIGLITGSNPKFVRLAHEVSLGKRWYPYLKTQSSTRWAGEVFEAIDWGGCGARIRARYSDVGATGGKYNGEEFYGVPGISATRVGGGSLKAQLFPAGLLFDSAASCGFTKADETRKICCAFLNSPLCQRWARELNGSFNYQAGDLNILPLIEIVPNAHSEIGSLVEDASRIVGTRLELFPTHWQFCPAGLNSEGLSLRQRVDGIRRKLLVYAQELGATETRIFTQIDELFAFEAEVAETERDRIDQVPEFSESELTATILSTWMLRLLGHRWPKQIEAAEPLPAWADQDGVIPLTVGGGETPLIERVRERLAADFPGGNVAALQQEFAEIVGTPLEQWLAGPFFERHISQFKKRPIAWQIETEARALVAEGKGKKKKGLKSAPVFACLVYYHKLDADLLPKIRTQYVGTLRSGFETELRNLERQIALTPEQQTRRLQLDAWIEEMKSFDTRLEQVSVRGFGPESMASALRQYAIADALLSLMASWLKKLNGVVEASPLKEWLQAADKANLHADLSTWVGNAFQRLDYFCAAVGPKVPEERSFPTDPTSPDLAPLVCAKPNQTVSKVLELACDRWWHKLDEFVLDPLKAQLKQNKEELDRIKEELKLDEVRKDYERAKKLADRQDELKRETKALREDIDEKIGKAKRLRKEIESWTCAEAATWEKWLGTQPLFDTVASLDGQRPPPQTIAEFITQESRYAPDINDGVRVNIAPIQNAGLLHADVLDSKDADKAIADRAEWRADERRWVREGKLPQPGWWKGENA